LDSIHQKERGNAQMKHPVRNTLLFVGGSLAVALFLGTASTARAAGLGELVLQSTLGQPLSAEIEIISMQAGEEDLEARLAPLVHQSAIERDPALSAIRFAIVHSAARSVLRLSTRQAVNGPYLEVPVELRSGTTRVVRQYTLLLDPPSSKSPSVTTR
jgi:pilus assembly protein FimV